MYEPLPVYKPAASRVQIEKALEMLIQSERPVIVAGGGVINADAAPLLQQFAELTNVPVIPTLMGWGCIPDDHPLMAGMVGLQTAHRYGNATLLASDMVLASVTVSPTVIRGPLRNILRVEKSSISILNRRKLAACCARIWASFLTPKRR